MYFQHSRWFWNRYNTAWPFRCEEPSSEHAAQTAASKQSGHYNIQFVRFYSLAKLTYSLHLLPQFHMQSLTHIDSQVTTLNSSFQKSQGHRTPVIKIIISQCLSTGPQPLPKPVIHAARTSTSDLNLQHLLVSLSATTSCLRLHRRLFVPSKFPAITCFKSQFLRKMCPIQLDCHRFYRMQDVILSS
jgi:hypothetical protein